VNEQSERTNGAKRSILSPADSEDYKKYWFIRKQYGWGWVPASWQGWAVLGIYTGALVSLFLRVDEEFASVDQMITNFFLPAIGITVLLAIVTWLKGEVPPKWQWGRINKDERKDH
jgi:hypothetical protein